MNEATLIGIDLDLDKRWMGITLAVLTLPPDGGPEPSDPRVKLILSPVGRIAASLRHGNWDDKDARVAAFSIEKLPEVVASFNQAPIYGWDFLDTPEEDDFATWADRLSLDWRSVPDGTSHTLDLFQEWGVERHLDLRIWFDNLRVFDPAMQEIPLDDFAAGGRRWWDAMHAGDERTSGHGIVSAAPEAPQGPE